MTRFHTPGSAQGDAAARSERKLGISFILNASDARSPPSKLRRRGTSPRPLALAGGGRSDASIVVAASADNGYANAATAAASVVSVASSVEDKRRGRTCKADGCPNYIVHKGLCCRHGGGKKCSLEGCNTSAKHWGLCWKHGGSIGCKVRNCTKRAKARGLCWGHGGGTKCGNAHCDKVAVSEGLCWAHGGGKRCIRAGCRRPGYERTLNYCVKHHAELMSASEAKMEASRDGRSITCAGSDTEGTEESIVV